MKRIKYWWRQIMWRHRAIVTFEYTEGPGKGDKVPDSFRYYAPSRFLLLLFIYSRINYRYDDWIGIPSHKIKPIIEIDTVPQLERDTGVLTIENVL